MTKPKFTRVVDGVPCLTITEHKHLMALHRAAIIAELCAGVEMPEGTPAWDIPWISEMLFVPIDQMREAVAAAVVKERELCAKVCDSMQQGWASDDHLACADAIRARGNV